MRSCAIALLFALVVFCFAFCVVALPWVCSTFSPIYSFAARSRLLWCFLLLVQDCSGVFRSVFLSLNCSLFGRYAASTYEK